MFGSHVLDVAIGLAFVYLLLSLLCTVVTELVAQALAMRSRTLEAGIRKLLNDEENDPKGSGLAQKLYEHPLVAVLARKGKGHALRGKGGRPSYIPSRTFALALLDIVAPAEGAGPKTIWAVRARIETQISDERVKRPLLILLDAAGADLDKARKSIETWFDDAMDRVTGWYKRNAQWILLAAGLVISLALNADSIMLANKLWIDPAMREVLVAAAEEAVKAPPAPGGEVTMKQLKEAQAQIQQLRLPIGWSTAPEDIRHLPADFWGWLAKLAGLAATIIAVSLGAPFWFEALNKLVNLRAGGKLPKKNPESGPESKPA